MGDRGNIFIIEPTSGDDPVQGVYFYTHWSGSELPAIVAAALHRGRGRWGDTAYLARIIFCELVQGEEMEETGYGISLSMCDNEHQIVVVDDWNRQVWFAEEGEEKNRATSWEKSSYEEFLAKFGDGES